MNQAILFSEGERWDENYSGVYVVAFVSGFQINCCVTRRFLMQRFADAGDPESCLSLFKRYRWDLEEELVARIEDQDFNADGWIVI
ncbi:DUF1488 domain-containing protein [Leminorella grimontii]|uniref:DUF1488 domain-containing protein n=1 Tax=Leminorella grimontii TaxID=82981 RepID=UPI00321F976B